MDIAKIQKFIQWASVIVTLLINLSNGVVTAPTAELPGGFLPPMNGALLTLLSGVAAWNIPKLLPLVMGWFKTSFADGKIDTKEVIGLAQIVLMNLDNLKPDDVKKVEATVGSIEIAKTLQLAKATELIRKHLKNLGNGEAIAKFGEVVKLLAELAYQKDGAPNATA